MLVGGVSWINDTTDKICILTIEYELQIVIYIIFIFNHKNRDHSGYFVVPVGEKRKTTSLAMLLEKNMVPVCHWRII